MNLTFSLIETISKDIKHFKSLKRFWNISEKSSGSIDYISIQETTLLSIPHDLNFLVHLKSTLKRSYCTLLEKNEITRGRVFCHNGIDANNDNVMNVECKIVNTIEDPIVDNNYK